VNPPDSPIVPEEPTPRTISRPWYKEWWLWTVLGAVVVTGAGLTIGLTQGNQNDSHASGVVTWR
jgi:hypothetical protein